MSNVNAVGAGSTYAGASSASSSQDIASVFKKAIKDYRDEQLTGLTDEEKAEIDRLCNEYLKNNPLNTDAQKAAYQEYYKSLLRRFGFKGEIDGSTGQDKDSSDADESAAAANIKSIIASIQGSMPGARFIVKQPSAK